MSDDIIVPSWEDLADRWMNAYLAMKAERDALAARYPAERLDALLAAVEAQIVQAHKRMLRDAIYLCPCDICAAFRAFREQVTT